MMVRHAWYPGALCCAASTLVLIAGCTGGVRNLKYLGDADLNYYKETATQIDYPHVHQELPDEIQLSDKPRTLLDRRKDEIWELTLAEALHTALVNNAIVRSGGEFLSPGNSLLTNPDRVNSVYDPAIQETGVLFGSRGIESALAAFDTTFSTSMVWGRNEVPQNNLFFGGGVVGADLVSETGAFTSQLSKQFGYGGQLSVNHNWNYMGNNAPGNLFPSAYAGLLSAEYRHPLLAGAGTEYTRIAGPVTQSFGGITGVTQGVVIARINNDITIADFEASVRNMVLDVENLYWELYLAYRRYDTAITARNSALRSWREAELKRQVGGVRNFQIEDEAQARDFYFAARAQAEAALSTIYQTEQSFRRLLGLSVNDGRIIRPSDEPLVAEFTPEWYACLTEALTCRVELRKQKWNIKSLELQLVAAESLTRPRLDLVSSYQVNGFGDKLLSSQSRPRFGNAYDTLTQGDNTGWTAGFQFTMPIGLRQAHAQVRNIELRLSKARGVLAAQELEISHELANAFQELAVQFVTAQTNFNRRRAAERRVQLFEQKVIAGTQTLDLLLRAHASLADAEVAYFTSLIRYNQAIANIHFRKGTLLEHNSVYLAENEWTPAAYEQALRKAWARSHAVETSLTHTEPAEFAQPGPASDIPEGMFPTSEASEEWDRMTDPLLAPPAPEADDDGKPQLVPPPIDNAPPPAPAAKPEESAQTPSELDELEIARRKLDELEKDRQPVPIRELPVGND